MTEPVPPSLHASPAPATPVASAMEIGFWTLVIRTGLSVLVLVINQLMEADSSLALSAWLRITSWFNVLVVVINQGLFTFVSLRVASAAPGVNRRLASTAAVLFVASALSIALWAVQLEPSSPLSNLRAVLGYALEYGSWGLLLIAIGRSAKAWGIRFPYAPLVVAILASVAATVASNSLQASLNLPYEQRPGPWLAPLLTGLGQLSTLSLAVVFYLCRFRLGRTRVLPSLEPRRVSTPEWRAASDGLSRYRAALLARIAIAVLGMVLVIAFALTGDQGAVRGLLVLVTLATLICGILSLTGLASYARIPELSGARGHARAALGFGLAGSAFDVGAAILAFRVSGGGAAAAWDFMGQAPWVEAGAQATGLVALMYLLASFHRAASALGASQPASNATSVGWILGIAGFAGVLVKVLATTGRGVSVLLALATPVVFALLVGIISFVSLMGTLVRTMHDGPPEPEEAGSLRSANAVATFENH